MNKENVTVSITCANGNVQEVQSDAVYGCAVTEDEKGGIACKSFFTGLFNPVKMGVPMGSSVALVQKRCAKEIQSLNILFLIRQSAYL